MRIVLSRFHPNWLERVRGQDGYNPLLCKWGNPPMVNDSLEVGDCLRLLMILQVGKPAKVHD